MARGPSRAARSRTSRAERAPRSKRVGTLLCSSPWLWQGLSRSSRASAHGPPCADSSVDDAVSLLIARIGARHGPCSYGSHDGLSLVDPERDPTRCGLGV